ncbi:hypothetical protein ACPUEX_22345 [Enterobacter vonholyi]
MILEIVYELFKSFSFTNIKCKEEIIFSISNIDVKHNVYPNILTIPFFNVNFEEGMILKNTYSTLLSKEYNTNVLNYSLNICFHSEKMNEHNFDENMHAVFTMSYYCILENMYRTLNKEDVRKILTLIN